MTDRNQSEPLHPGLTRRELVQRGGVAAGAMSLAWLLAACGGEGSNEAGSGVTGSAGGQTTSATSPDPLPGGGAEVDQLVWAMNDDAISMDYAFDYDFNTSIPVTNMTEPLLRFSPEGELEPNLAEAWEQVDARTYVYTIRSGVLFHDGSELTADDVVFSLNRHRDPEVGSFLATFHERVANVEATGPLEVSVTLSEPDAIWQYAAATNAAAIASKAFIEQQGAEFGKPAVGTAGTGPYKFVSWTPGQEIVLERFDDYWNKDRPLKVKRLVAKIVKDEATLLAALGTGEIDGVFGSALSGKSVKAAERLDGIQVYRTSSYLIHYLIINTQMPPFDDVRVRQALSYAIDKAGLLASVWAGEGELTKSPPTPSMWTFAKDTFQGAYDALPAFELDLETAKSLIAEAGATGTSAKMLVSLPYDEEQAIAIQAAAKEIGLDLTPEKLPYGDKIAQEFSGEPTRSYALSISQWGSDIPDPAGNLQLPFYSKNLVTNNSVYKNPEVDELLQAQRASTDPEERAQLLTQAQEIVVNDQPWVIFYTPNTTMVVSDRVTGYELRPLWYWDAWAADFSGVE